MNEKVNGKLETLAFVAIIFMCLVTTVVLVKSNFLQDNKQMDINIAKGTKISINNEKWQNNNKNLILVLSTECTFCTRSASFYKKLTEEKTQNNARIIAVFPQSTQESEKYLSELGISVDSIKQVQLSEIGVKATPTLILVNKDGVALDSWVGKLPEEKEIEVMNKLREAEFQAGTH